LLAQQHVGLVWTACRWPLSSILGKQLLKVTVKGGPWTVDTAGADQLPRWLLPLLLLLPQTGLLCRILVQYQPSLDAILCNSAALCMPKCSAGGRTKQGQQLQMLGEYQPQGKPRSDMFIDGIRESTYVTYIFIAWHRAICVPNHNTGELPDFALQHCFAL